MSDGEVLIVGSGGLGVPAALAAANAGVRRIGLIDPDPVELSNLHRQIIYRSSDLGIPKVEAAARHLKERAPGLAVTTFPCSLDDSNAARIIVDFGFVIDATDDPATKFLINDVCVAAHIPFVYGGVLGLTGQLMTVLPRQSACLRCLFENPPDEGEVASCRAAGIVGPVAGAIGGLQGMEAARVLRRAPAHFADRMLTYNASGAAPRIRLVSVSAREGCGCAAAAGRPAAADGVYLERS